MIEILFRGKCIDDGPDFGKWVEGYYLRDDGNGTGYICRMSNAMEDDWLEDISTAVDNATVGQYTGLKDKNGKKIFEGDVVKIFDPGDSSYTDYLVEYCADNASHFGVHREEFSTVYSEILRCRRRHYEVIGNAHDNPELMEGKK